MSAALSDTSNGKGDASCRKGCHSHNAKVSRCLNFLDRSHIDPCSDEILMNTAPWNDLIFNHSSAAMSVYCTPCAQRLLPPKVLETYIRHKEFRRCCSEGLMYRDCGAPPTVPTVLVASCGIMPRRLETLLHKFAAQPATTQEAAFHFLLVCLSQEQSNLRPSVPTYGSIIKAYANLKCPEKCWHYWNAARLSLPAGGFALDSLRLRLAPTSGDAGAARAGAERHRVWLHA